MAISDAVSERVRLARSSVSDDQQRYSDMAVAGDAMLDGSALRRIEMRLSTRARISFAC